ncbi:PREDICTED: arabinogalactan peptide 12-like [Camelina sativa]|uniref:Arabinogalactan peptide 12-like n=1 Tax=Camelina sativa TaxID=90675 RepID=A0ABM1RRG8_CAMSA|nr:PREDICTED: arabinogalactan peptide 12-like [Camelina sativa]
MESMKMNLMVVLMVAVVAFSTVGKAAAQTEAPAPSPTSDAAMFVPALFASVVALASGFLF